MDSNVRKVIFVSLLLVVLFVSVFSVKYFKVSKENSLTFALVILSFVYILQVFVDHKKECYNNIDEKPKVYKYSSLSRYNSV
jgi:hypothetical protein